MIRKIIHIDEEKCDGCGICANACHEGAIDIIDGKAKLVREHFCDGLFGNEIIGFIVCTAYVVLGLPVKFPVFYCAGFMYRRGTIGMAIAMAGIVLAFTLIAGTKKINRMDIFSE